MIRKDGRVGICQRIANESPWGNAGWRYEINGDVAVPPANLVKPKLPTQTVADLVAEWRLALSPAQSHELARKLRVHPATMGRLDVGWNAEKESYTFPMRNAVGEFCGARFRLESGRKFSLSGGADGLFIPRGALGGKRLFVTEGPTDCAAMLSCRFDAIGRPNCLTCIDMVAMIVKRFRPELVVIVCDPDTAGMMGAGRLYNALSGLASVRAIRPRGYKDARACAACGGRRDAILEAVAGKTNAFWEPIR
jgi:hypothetical protein